MPLLLLMGMICRRCVKHHRYHQCINRHGRGKVNQQSGHMKKEVVRDKGCEPLPFHDDVYALFSPCLLRKYSAQVW